MFVNLLDLNDNDPTFQNLPFAAEIAEGLPAGTSVFQVGASHPSLPVVPRGPFFYPSWHLRGSGFTTGTPRPPFSPFPPSSPRRWWPSTWTRAPTGG